MRDKRTNSYTTLASDQSIKQASIPFLNKKLLQVREIKKLKISKIPFHNPESRQHSSWVSQVILAMSSCSQSDCQFCSFHEHDSEQRHKDAS